MKMRECDKISLLQSQEWHQGFEFVDVYTLADLVKHVKLKAFGEALLTFNELEETLLDIECFMSN